MVLQKYGLFKQLQQAFVQAFDADSGTVVTLHELLYRQAVFLVYKAKLLGQGALIVKQQAILAAAGEEMQGKANFPQ